MSGRTLGTIFIVAIWMLVGVVVLTVGLEYYLESKWTKRFELKDSGRPRHDALLKAYHPFAIQHINPTYLFFFPFDPAERMALSNDHATLDSAGFRGPGPEFAGDRELAFLLGGSTAFSYSSADSTSITGYLNRLQERYFFVNAGVPSWNSTQELFRLAHQVLAYEPSLVLTFDGANDMAILVQQHKEDLHYPPGTPESFHDLQTLVGNIRAGPSGEKERGFFDRYLPRLMESYRAHFHPQPPAGPIPEDRIRRVAAKYIENTSLMAALVNAKGGTFASIFQPIVWLHENGPPHEEAYEYRDAYRTYHSAVFGDTTVAFQRYDFGSFFDRGFDEIPYLDPKGETDLTDDIIFVDPVHFFDRGNRLIAEQIVSKILPEAATDSTP